ncbi:MAG: LysM peptidoglycan-binding domain-containing protein [Patescibacteria group bacterium]|nr:LysM peptidoglycan-binding domain-containing protein [Patescibacteria group bacterium]
MSKIKYVLTHLVIGSLYLIKKIQTGIKISLQWFLKLVGQLFFKWLIFPFYKIGRRLAQKIRLINAISLSKIKFLILQKKALHFFIIGGAILIVGHNIKASDVQEGSYQDQPLFYSLNKISQEEITEGPLPAPTLVNENLLPIMSYDQKLENEFIEILKTPNYGGLIENPTLVADPNINASDRYIPARSQIEYYVVQSGDTIGSIAEKYGLSQKTILWENNLTYNSVIRPGQKITVLPIDGVSHKIKSGDTINSLAKKYQTEKDKILEFNHLAVDDSLILNQNLIIPGGIKYTPTPTPTYSAPSSTQIKKYYGTPKGGHIFPWGHCTYYVSTRRYIPWGGDAKHWLRNAQAYGYSIGKTPTVGSIIATRESWWGHVGYVESVGKNTVTFSEMNYKGLGIYSERTLKLNDSRIIGYIY